MLRVQERKQVADRDRPDTLGDEFCHGVPHRRFIERHNHLALRGDLLAHFFAPCAWSKEHGRDRFQDDAVQVLAELIADLKDVTKTFAGDEADLRALPLEHRVGGDCGAMQEPRDFGGGDPEIAGEVGYRVQHRLAGVATRGRDFQRSHRLADATTHDVGEGATDVDTDIDGRFRAGHARSFRLQHGSMPG